MHAVDVGSFFDFYSHDSAKMEEIMLVFLLIAFVVAVVVLYRSVMSLLGQIPARNRDFIAFPSVEGVDHEPAAKADTGQRAGHGIKQMEQPAG